MGSALLAVRPTANSGVSAALSTDLIRMMDPSGSPLNDGQRAALAASVGNLSISTAPDVELGVVADVGASIGFSGDDKVTGPATINVGLRKHLGVQLTRSNTPAWNQLPWYDPSRYVNAVSTGIGAAVPYVPAIPGPVSINPLYSSPSDAKK